MGRSSSTTLLFFALLITQLSLARAVVSVGGGGNGDWSKGPWNGGPEPNTLGLSFGSDWFQPTIDGTPQSHTPGSMAAVVDLNQASVQGPGVYTSIGPLARTAKIYTYLAANETGGLGVLQTGMPTISPREDPFFGVLEFALSEDGDGTYRVGVKFNNMIKVIKFSNANTIISEFKVNTLGLQDYKGRGAVMACNSTCLPSHGCNSKTRGTGISTELWGLVAHSDRTALVVKVIDRVWFQLYSDDGTLLQNVDLNLWGYPQSNILSETGKLKYGYAFMANYYSGGFPYQVYYAYYHSSEGGCDHQGEQLIIVDPTNWKSCSSGRPNWKTSDSATDVAVALAWGGSHSFARRLAKVKSGYSDQINEDIIALAILDTPFQRSPKYPGKGGIELLGPHNGQVAPTYWFPDGYTQTLMGDWVYPEGGWNGVAVPYYYLVGCYSQQVDSGFVAFLVVIRGDHVRGVPLS